MSALRNRRIVVTRADEQADELCARLEALGAEPVRVPTIRIAPPESFEAIDAALERLATYDWVVFTSANGVRAVLARAGEAGASVGAGVAAVAAVGRVTADLLADHGVTATFVPETEGAIGLGGALPAVAGKAILLCQGEKADPILAKILRERGADRVDAIVAYRTLPTAPSGPGLEELRIGVNAITFTSPSTVEGFVSIGPEWRKLARHAIVVTIGPTTTAAAMRMGVGVHEEARERTMGGLIDALTRSFSRPPGVGFGKEMRE